MRGTKSVRVLFWILSLGVALVSWRFMVAGVPLTMPFMVPHLETRALALYAHITLAPVALAVLPFQFRAGLRAARPRLHRWLGRLYVGAVVISGGAGLNLAVGTPAGPVAGWGFGLLGVLWLGVTLMALAHVLAGRIAAHRRWMIRSAALTFAAVTLRLYLPVLMPVFGFETAYVIIAWLCWVPNAALAEWYLRRDRVGAVPA